MEMFLLEGGELLLNEVAPRPHNSGHYTIEGCATSQFEQHLRAVMGWPLGSPELLVGSWCAPDMATLPQGIPPIVLLVLHPSYTQHSTAQVAVCAVSCCQNTDCLGQSCTTQDVHRLQRRAAVLHRISLDVSSAALRFWHGLPADRAGERNFGNALTYG